MLSKVMQNVVQEKDGHMSPLTALQAMKAVCTVALRV